MKMSIISSAYVMKYTLEDSVKEAAKAGYDAIDLFASAPHAEPRLFSKKRRRELKKLIDSLGLQVNQISSFGHPTSGFFAEMEGYVKAQIERLEFGLEMGANHLELVPGDKRPDFSAETTWKWAVESHREIAKEAERLNMPIAIELEPIQPYQQMWGKPMPPNVYDLKTLKKFIDDIGSDYCKANIDIGHLNIVAKGKPESIKDEFWNLKEYIVGTHCNDNDGTTDLNLVPGRGNCDFKYYLKLLYDMGYKGYVSIELEAEEDPVPTAKESLDYIKTILKKINAYG